MESHSTHAQPTSYDYGAVPRVSIDGKPHEMLALVACVSGLVIATILVSVIILVLRRAQRTEWHKMKNTSPNKDVEAQTVPEIIPSPESHQPKVKIFTIFGSTKQSFDLSTT